MRVCFTVSPVPAETPAAPMYLTHPRMRGFTVTDSPGIAPDSMFRLTRKKQPMDISFSIVLSIPQGAALVTLFFT